MIDRDKWLKWVFLGVIIVGVFGVMTGVLFTELGISLLGFACIGSGIIAYLVNVEEL